MEWINSLFEKTTDLTILQMLIRAVIVFILALAMLRIAGKRTFGKQSAADNVIMFILGALLSRAITGASPFVPVIVASFGIIMVHRLFAWLCLKSKKLGAIIKGEPISLFKDDRKNLQNMKEELISEDDLLEGVRLQINSDSLEDVKEAFIERDGHITVIKKQ